MAAIGFAAKLRAEIGDLALMPERFGIVAGVRGPERAVVRRRLVRDYMIYFIVRRREVVVLRVLHGARRVPQTVSAPTVGFRMPTLYLIDGYAQFFRHYHAIRTPMTSPVTKEPTNMTFGFVGMLLKLLRGEGKIGGRPEYVAVTLDVGGTRRRSGRSCTRSTRRTGRRRAEDLGPQVDRGWRGCARSGCRSWGRRGSRRTT